MKISSFINQGLLTRSLVLSSVLFAGCTSQPPVSGPKEASSLFVTKVKPVLQYYCIQCHTDQAAPQYGGFSMETGKSALTTGRHSPVIRPGKPDESLFFKVLRLGHEDVLGMPPAPDKVTNEELESVRQWILSGAEWPAGPAGHLQLPKS
ncbi:MAG: hypothetical protein RL693_475 [Verrucomicrobiota bacterium]|jgi:mono/diheme cytochrome c family protein